MNQTQRKQAAEKLTIQQIEDVLDATEDGQVSLNPDGTATVKLTYSQLETKLADAEAEIKNCHHDITQLQEIDGERLNVEIPALEAVIKAVGELIEEVRNEYTEDCTLDTLIDERDECPICVPANAFLDKFQALLKEHQ